MFIVFIFAVWLSTKLQIWIIIQTLWRSYRLPTSQTINRNWHQWVQLHCHQAKWNVIFSKVLIYFYFSQPNKCWEKKIILLKIVVVCAITARAEEEATSTPIKLTKQLFVKPAINTNNLSNTNNLLNGEDSMSAATFVSVVSNTFQVKKKPICFWNCCFLFNCDIVCFSFT